MKYEVEKLMSANVILTNNCNSKCISCDYWKYSQVNIDITCVKEFFDEINKYGNKSVVLTGGEPTLHPDFFEIVKIAKEYGFTVILSTNGSTINKIFTKVKDVIDSFCISFDGCSREQYIEIRGIDNFENIINSIAMIKSYSNNIQVWLSCLIQKRNYTDIIKIYDTAYNSGADGIFFNVPELKEGCFGHEKNTPARGTLMIENGDISELEKIFQILLKKDKKKHFLCQSEETFIKFSEYFRLMNNQCEPRLRRCFVPYNTITLNEFGKVKPCFYIKDAFDFSKDLINGKEMSKVRRELYKNPEYINQCSYCCQFNT